MRLYVMALTFCLNYYEQKRKQLMQQWICTYSRLLKYTSKVVGDIED